MEPSSATYVLDPPASFDIWSLDRIATMHLDELYYWWLRFSEIDTSTEMENVFMGNGLIDYLPPILELQDIYCDFTFQETAQFTVKSIKVSIEPLLGFLQDVLREKPAASLIEPDAETANQESSGLFSKLTSFWKRRPDADETSNVKSADPEKPKPAVETDVLSGEFSRVLKFEKLIESYPTNA
jgi:hypothetical protein